MQRCRHQTGRSRSPWQGRCPVGRHCKEDRRGRWSCPARPGLPAVAQAVQRPLPRRSAAGDRPVCGPRTSPRRSGSQGGAGMTCSWAGDAQECQHSRGVAGVVAQGGAEVGDCVHRYGAPATAEAADWSGDADRLGGVGKSRPAAMMTCRRRISMRWWPRSRRVLPSTATAQRGRDAGGGVVGGGGCWPASEVPMARSRRRGQRGPARDVRWQLYTTPRDVTPGSDAGIRNNTRS
jgi:hypothetical protein